MNDHASATAPATFEDWVILELRGHRRLAGYLQEQQIGGASFLRLDVPSSEICERCSGACGLQETDLDGRPTRTEDPCTDCDVYGTALQATQFYAPSGVYCITPTPEEIALSVLAEAVAVHHGRNGGPMRDRDRAS